MFEINVSLNGEHYFATHTRSINSEQKGKKLVSELKTIYPESKGYKISLSYVQTTSQKVDLSDVK